jgi:hypothetical protein
VKVSGKGKAKERLQRSDAQASKEVLLLWAILGEGGGKDVSRSALDKKGMLPGDDKAARDGLEGRGLIKAEKRGSRNEKGRLINSYWMSITASGRAWAEENLAAMPSRSQAAAPTLQAWLTRLSIFLHARNISMTEFLEPHGESTREVPAHPSNYDEMRTRIRRAYLELTGGRLNTRVRLCHVREKLSDVERASLDEALKKMQREQEASLYPLDNKTEITDADQNAAIYFGGEPRHILWIEQ